MIPAISLETFNGFLSQAKLTGSLSSLTLKWTDNHLDFAVVDATLLLILVKYYVQLSSDAIDIGTSLIAGPSGNLNFNCFLPSKFIFSYGRSYQPEVGCNRSYLF
jgi:hypothetical protein